MCKKSNFILPILAPVPSQHRSVPRENTQLFTSPLGRKKSSVHPTLGTFRGLHQRLDSVLLVQCFNRTGIFWVSGDCGEKFRNASCCGLIQNTNEQSAHLGVQQLLKQGKVWRFAAVNEKTSGPTTDTRESKRLQAPEKRTLKTSVIEKLHIQAKRRSHVQTQPPTPKKRFQSSPNSQVG